MAPKTSSGRTLEKMISSALDHNGYTYLEQARVANSIAGREHRIDFVITSPVEVFVSVKWQGSEGSVEEKVPFEVIRLMHLLSQNEVVVRKGSKNKKNLHEISLHPRRAYVVLAGNGWNPKLKEWYTSGGLLAYLPYHGYRISIEDWGSFIRRVNNKGI